MPISHHYANPAADTGAPYLMASREGRVSIRSAPDNPAERSIRLAAINGYNAHIHTHAHIHTVCGEEERGGAKSLGSTRLTSEVLFISLVRAEEE